MRDGALPALYIGAEHFVRRDIRLHGRAVSLDTEIVRYAW